MNTEIERQRDELITHRGDRVCIQIDGLVEQLQRQRGRRRQTRRRIMISGLFAILCAGGFASLQQPSDPVVQQQPRPVNESDEVETSQLNTPSDAADLPERLAEVKQRLQRLRLEQEQLRQLRYQQQSWILREQLSRTELMDLTFNLGDRER